MTSVLAERRAAHDAQWDADAGVYRLVWIGPRYGTEVKGPYERAAG